MRLAVIVGLTVACGAADPARRAALAVPGAAVRDSVAAARSDSAASAVARGSAAAPEARAPASGARDSTASGRTALDSLARLAPDELVPVAVLVQGGAARGELVEPVGIASDAFGRLFVADAALHRLERYDASGARSGQAGTLGSAEGELRRPGSVALLGTLLVAVLDVENRRVLLYDVNARLQGTLVDFDDAELERAVGRVEPRALASDRGGALYVVDAERDRLLVFDFAGRFVKTIGGFGDAPGSFRALAAIAVARRGELVTLERARRRVQRLDPGGTPLAAFYLPGGETQAMALAVDDSLRVAVAEERPGRVTVWDGAGRLLAARAGLDHPRALAFTPGGTLVIAEAGGGRLTRYRLELRPKPER